MRGFLNILMHKRRDSGRQGREKPSDSVDAVLKSNFEDTPEQKQIRGINKVLNKTISVTGIHGCVDVICLEFGFRGFREEKEIVGLHDLKHELSGLQVHEEVLEKKIWDAEYPDHKEAEEVVRRIFNKDMRDDALGKKVYRILESISKRQGGGNIDMGELIRELRKTHRPPDYKEILRLQKDMVATRLDAYEKVVLLT